MCRPLDKEERKDYTQRVGWKGSSVAPLARLEFGEAADSLDRYARLAPDGAVVTVAEFEVRRLTELLRAVGAGS